MLKISLLGVLLTLALLACQPMTTELSSDEQATPNADAKSTSIPVPLNKFTPKAAAQTTINSDSSVNSGLRLISAKSDDLGFRHMKYQAVHQGVLVWGAETIIHINKQDKIYRVDGDIPEIDPALNTTPKLNAESAATAALAVLDGDGWSSISTQLFVYATNDHASLAWQVECVNAAKRKFLLVDANTGRILKTVEGSHS